MADEPRKQVSANGATEETRYSHSQFGRPIAVGTGLGIAVATLTVFSLSSATLTAVPWLVAALYAILGIAFALFYRLLVRVDRERVRMVFGVGLVRKECLLADIRRVDIVRTRFWWGYGVHWTTSGWLYNVGGRWAVRLELASDRPIMIGTDEPDALKDAIEAMRQAKR